MTQMFLVDWEISCFAKSSTIYFEKFTPVVHRFNSCHAMKRQLWCKSESVLVQDILGV